MFPDESEKAKFLDVIAGELGSAELELANRPENDIDQHLRDFVWAMTKISDYFVTNEIKVIEDLVPLSPQFDKEDYFAGTVLVEEGGVPYRVDYLVNARDEKNIRYSLSQPRLDNISLREHIVSQVIAYMEELLAEEKRIYKIVEILGYDHFYSQEILPFFLRPTYYAVRLKLINTASDVIVRKTANLVISETSKKLDIPEISPEEYNYEEFLEKILNCISTSSGQQRIGPIFGGK